MTPTLANYQESVNTLHFGQKAKHVKTSVNVNEISQGMLNGTAGPELEKAQREINELKSKLKEYETKMVEFQNSFQDQLSSSTIIKEDSEMIDESAEPKQRASIGAGHKD